MMFVDETIYTNRPQSGESREERTAYDLLERLGVSFTRVEHEPAETIDACKAVEDILGIEICKNLFLTNAGKTIFYLLMMPGHKRFVTKDASKKIGSSRLSFAGAAYLQALLGVAPGSVSVLALANDQDHRVQLVIDKEILAAESFGCHPCKNTASLRIHTAALLDKILPATGHKPLVVEL